VEAVEDDACRIVLCFQNLFGHSRCLQAKPRLGYRVPHGTFAKPSPPPLHFQQYIPRRPFVVSLKASSKLDLLRTSLLSTLPLMSRAKDASCQVHFNRRTRSGSSFLSG